ncbi:MAG: polymerase alpha subunit [Clostridia bacterium]|jgi:DNA polymerase-3 subunit alpha (Gram-positive type)|nr:polymerase alpha subunit [Clostridia bacterium]
MQENANNTSINSKYADSFEIKAIKVFQKSSTWEITIRLKQELKLTDIKAIEESFILMYQLKGIKINIENWQENTSHEEFLYKHWEEIKLLAYQNNPSLMGFLNEAELRMEDKVVHIIVPNKILADFLNAKKCGEIFENFVQNYLSRDYRFKIEYKEEGIKAEEHHSNLIQEEQRLVAETMSGKAKSTKASKDADQGSNAPVVILGRSFNDSPIDINEITQDSGRVTIQGSIFNVESKTLNNGKTIITFNITDFTNSMTVKLFVKEDTNPDKLLIGIADGKHVKLKGDVQYDTYVKELVIYPINILEAERSKRKDQSSEKRVELHAHTTMSSMDGFCSASQLVKRAKEWGHKAIAITDHGVVQAFPEAFETAKKTGIKVLYGVEGYFINDGAPIVFNEDKFSFDDDIVIFDIETTGLSASADRITEIGAVKIRNREVIERYSTLINPEMAIPYKITELTGITNEMVADQRTIKDVMPEFLNFVGNCPLVAHNAMFDWGFIRTKASELGYNLNSTIIDTLQLARILLPDLKKHKLNLICQHLNIKLENHHRAVHDAEATAQMFLKFVEMLQDREIEDVEQINSITSSQKTNLKNTENYHIIILVKNKTGLKNLYKLISIAHLNYFYKKPRILKSLLMQHREGLIIGSACEAGEIYRNILSGVDDNTLMNNAKFYDYLEIQPISNNEFLTRNGRVAGPKELEKINDRIVKLAEKLGKPYVATGDVHFLDPEDEVYRRVIMGGQGFSDADEQAPLYLKTTEEMLDEFSYLGEERAYNAVIRYPNQIADEIGDIIPIPEDTFPPIIEGSEDQIREMTMNKAHSIYGEVLPEVVEKRLEKELTSIIKHGFSVMYLIAQKLVTKSLQDGYLVGSRGSVGSSFVATMCDITEVNPLPPHYICTSCKTSEFFMDGSILSGADLPDGICPNCGKEYKKDGHDIPFETFLGFDGDKEPDIDLNFAGEYQAEAHKYTEELFGKGYVFRAGTIGTIAEKTAYGFVKKYNDERNKSVHSAEIDRLIKGCTGIKRTTGQHPGGVMIVPSYTDIYEFTPIQKPADDTDSNIITTHFDYHSISGRLLKLDILGHDVPTIIKMLEDITGFKATDILLDDKDTMSLFTTTEALGINLDDIDCKSGSLGIPEFGTKFVRQMLLDTMPTTFAELARISGLSHGTDVWINNAQEMVRNGTCVLKEVISTRDDIMVYLIYKGVPPKMSFKIMENVRKGKGLTPEHVEAMREKDVPEWYIDSCNKIKYMFPKAHAVAYVMMSFRIAYYKVHYPEAFYATFFTVKVEDFDADLFIRGKEAVLAKWKEIDKLGNNASTKEKNTATLLEVVYEMYLRGVKLLPVDLYKSAADRFAVTEEGLLPPLNALQGVGINAAYSIAKEREVEPFFSIDEFRQRTKVSKTVIEILKNHGCFKEIPESSQISLF